MTLPAIRGPWRSAAWAAALLLAATAWHTRAEDAPASGALRIRVDREGTGGRDTPRVWLRGEGGLVRHAPHRAFAFAQRARPVEYAVLTPGRYELACRIGVALNGPWHFVFRSVRVRPGKTTVVEVGLPEGREAGLDVVAEKGSPPYVCFLCAPDGPWPKKPTLWTPRGRLARLLDESAFPEGRRFEAQGRGQYQPDKSRRLTCRGLLSGTYRFFVMANDWQPGDPPVMLRSVPVKLKRGKPAIVRLTGKLATIAVEYPR